MTDTTTPQPVKHPKKPTSLVGMVPAPEIESYDSVPWYRRQWFALFPLFAPALIVIALTGGIYASATKPMQSHSDAKVWRYTTGSRLFFVACAVFAIVVVTEAIWW